MKLGVGRRERCEVRGTLTRIQLDELIEAYLDLLPTLCVHDNGLSPTFRTKSIKRGSARMSANAGSTLIRYIVQACSRYPFSSSAIVCSLSPSPLSITASA